MPKRIDVTFFSRWRCCLFLLTLLSQSQAHALHLPTPPQAGATAARAGVCVVKYRDRILVVQDRLSSRFGITGGLVDPGETPAEAALRELWEETGYRGKIVRYLGRWDKADVFSCRTKTTLVAQKGSNQVDILRADNLGNEIINARLIAIDQLPRHEQRFPEQYAWVAERWSHLANSPVRWRKNFAKGSRALHVQELPLIRALQQQLAGATWLHGVNLLGHHLLHFALLPLVIGLFGWQRVRPRLFAMLWLGLGIEILKESFNWPRPFHLDPHLASDAVQGFGMPSGYPAAAWLFFGAAFMERWPHHRRAGVLAALLIACGVGLARVWLGVHFISDVLAGLLLGGLALSLHRYWNRVLRKTHGWFYFSFCVIVTLWTLSPQVAALGAFGAGLTLGGYFTPRTVLRPTRQFDWQLASIAYLGGVALLLLVWQIEASNPYSLIILLSYLVLCGAQGLWLAVGIPWTKVWLCRHQPSAAHPEALPPAS
ncbi:MAG: bifunctional NUDIX hydrolase/phosphatase PAP2 family protein [Aeromonas sp.]